MQKRNGALQSIRFICAFFIFLHHWPLFDSNPVLSVLNSRLFYYLYSPVTFFFILSGWALTRTYYDTIHRRTFSFPSYIKKRLLKLYPIHLLTFVLIIPMIWTWLPQTPMQITLANLFLVHSFIPSSLYLLSYNGVSWCLSIFLFWYIVFPYVMLIFSYFDSFIRTYAAVVAVVLVAGLGLWIYANAFDNATPYALYFSPFERLVDCLVGVCLYFVTRQLEVKTRISFAYWSLIELGAVGMIVATHWFAYVIPVKYTWDIYFIIPYAVLIGVFSISRGILSGFLSWKPFVLLGTISLEFFLMHFIVLRWVYFYVTQYVTLTTLQLGIFTVTVTIAASFLARFFLNWLTRIRINQL